MSIREEITEKLLNNINKALECGADDIRTVNVFSEFIKTLVLESEMLGMHKDKIASEVAVSALMAINASNDKLSEQQIDLANRYTDELATLFKLSGDQSEALKELSSKIKKAGLRLDTV